MAQRCGDLLYAAAMLRDLSGTIVIVVRAAPRSASLASPAHHAAPDSVHLTPRTLQAALALGVAADACLHHTRALPSPPARRSSTLRFRLGTQCFRLLSPGDSMILPWNSMLSPCDSMISLVTQ